MLGILFLMTIGGGVYWLMRIRPSVALHGSLAEKVAELREEVQQLREAQWRMRTAVDSLREEQDFKNQLLTPIDPKV